MGLPPLDICKLEASGVGEGVDMNQVWHVVCKLSDETDNIRLTGNRCFDTRYLNYNQKGELMDNNFYDRDSKVKGDWRTHFLTRTAQILLHSFDLKRLPIAPAHSERCDRARADIPEQDSVELECDCWGCGIDPTHHIFLQRLMTVPPHSNIAKTFCKMEQRSAHFKDVTDLQCGGSLLVPFRYAKHFADDVETSVVDLLSMLVKGCQFRPKLLPVHCEFFYHSELYQLFVQQAGQSNDLAHSLLAEFLSDLEGVEFYWVGGLRGANADGEMTFEANPSIHIPKLFLETALSSSLPKLDTVCIRMYGTANRFAYDMPKLDSCLSDIAPLFSSTYVNEHNRKLLPISAPYKGMKKLHIFGEIGSKSSGDVISSILLHQTVVEGLEIRCTSRIISPGYIFDPMYDILTQPHVQFLVMAIWRQYDFKELFYKFLDVNPDYDVSFATLFNEVVIPARNCESDSVHRRKTLRVISPPGDASYLGVVFAWLREAKMDVSLRSITMKTPIMNVEKEECFLSCLSTCQALTMEVKGSFPFSECFGKLKSNTHLRVLQIHSCLPFISLIDNFCEMLSAVYTNCTKSLTELSLLNNRIGSLPPEKLGVFFKTLASFANLGQLSVNLRGNSLKDADLDVLLKVWRAAKTECKFKSLSVDSSEQEERVAEMVVEC